MKTNEILTEGPVWDKVKKFVAPTPAQSGQSERAKEIKEKTNLLWASLSRNLTSYRTAHGEDPPEFADFVVKYTDRYFKKPTTIPRLKNPAIVSSDDSKAIYDYLAGRMAESLGGASEETPPAPPAAPAPPNTTPAPPAAPAPNTTPAPLAPKIDAATFTANLQSEWDKFVDSGKKASPELRQLIKRMWLDAGGIKAESKKNQKKKL